MALTTSKEVVLTQSDLFKGNYDEANPLVLPSSRAQKNKTVKTLTPKHKQRCLTKNQRKALEKIVKRRNNKKNRVDLLNELQQHALPEQVYKSLTPLVEVQQLKKSGQTSKSGLIYSKSFGLSLAKDTYTIPNSLLETNLQHNVETSDSDSDESVLVMEVEKIVAESTNPDLVKKQINLDYSDLKDNVEDGNHLKVIGNTVSLAEKSPSTGLNTVSMMKKEIKKTNVVDYPRLAHIIPNRTKDVEMVRSKLPIIGEEQVIMEAISENLVVVLASETGSGKTTQVPQFLYEAGYASNGKIIGVTEPRRIAAIAMSQRVSMELNLPNDIVSYQIRFVGNTSKKTKIKFMTDGVLLKEMENDFLLSHYSVICIDEAHERSLYTDILIGLLSRTVVIRQKKHDPLRVVIMSATMRVEDFTSNSVLFKIPPSLIHIPVRQYPVHIHFNKITPENYLEAAKKKISKIHSSLPEGGILVFVTGQEEVKRLVKMVRQTFPSPTYSSKKSHMIKGIEVTNESPPGVTEFDLNKVCAFPTLDADESKEEEETKLVNTEEVKLSEILVIPLYSLLSIKEQEKVFAPSPRGVRVCVIATNVAETSLTIPGIRYVVDCGKVKLKLWNKLTGVQKYEVTWCSKASSHQRAGRAGRTGPGHCYRLFSSAVYHTEFKEYSVPEIAVRPVDDMILLMKSMSINQVQNFPYPTHPGSDQLVAAEHLLILLGALEIPEDFSSLSDKENKSRITPLGKAMAYLPVSPRYSKMVAISFPHSVVEYVITLVAALSVQEVLLDVSMDSEEDKETRLRWKRIRRKWGGTGSSLLLGDCMVLLRAVGAFEFEGGTFESALRLGLRYKSMLEIRKLRKKLTVDINLVSNLEEIMLNPQMRPPTTEQMDLLRQVILSGSPDRIAKRIQAEELSGDMRKYKHAYYCGELEEPVFIYDSSVLRGSDPDWIVYQESFEYNGKIYLKGITAIEPEWIPTLCPVLCKMDKPVKDPSPYYDHTTGTVKCFVKVFYGKQGWELPLIEMEHPTLKKTQV